VVAKKDKPKVISLELSRQVVFVHRIGDASLLSICKKNVKPSVYMPSIEKSVAMLEQGSNFEQEYFFF